MHKRAQRSRKKVYYAHPICTYGWPSERRELTAIRRAFPGSRIVNPAAYRNHPAKRRDGMRFCLGLVARADVVVFSRLLAKVTSGVGKEVNHALQLGKRVFGLATGSVVRRGRRVAYLTRRATLALYEQWRLEQYRRTWARPHRQRGPGGR